MSFVWKSGQTCENMTKSAMKFNLALNTHFNDCHSHTQMIVTFAKSIKLLARTLISQKPGIFSDIFLATSWSGMFSTRKLTWNLIYN